MTNATQLTALQIKIAKVLGIDSNSLEVIKIAKGWVKFTELGIQSGLTFDEADKMTYTAFKNDTDNFATFCTIVNL